MSETPVLRIPEDRLTTAIRAAYDLSQPQGMGFMHFNPAPMTEDQAEKILVAHRPDQNFYFDYLSGRAVKLTIHRDGAGYFVKDEPWFDHTGKDWEEFKRRVFEEAPQRTVVATLKEGSSRG